VKRYPIAFCPCCGRTILYSGDPKDKATVTVVRAAEGDTGKTILCAKCKTMLAVRERVNGKTVLVPIAGILIN